MRSSGGSSDNVASKTCIPRESEGSSRIVLSDDILKSCFPASMGFQGDESVLHGARSEATCIDSTCVSFPQTLCPDALCLPPARRHERCRFPIPQRSSRAPCAHVRHARLWLVGLVCLEHTVRCGGRVQQSRRGGRWSCDRPPGLDALTKHLVELACCVPSQGAMSRMRRSPFKWASYKVRLACLHAPPGESCRAIEGRCHLCMSQAHIHIQRRIQKTHIHTSSAAYFGDVAKMTCAHERRLDGWDGRREHWKRDDQMPSEAQNTYFQVLGGMRMR